MFQDKKNELQVHGNSRSNIGIAVNKTVSRNASGTFKNAVICYSCGQPGHIARNCLTKPFTPKKMDRLGDQNICFKGKGAGPSPGSVGAGFALN